jgi:plastocyanin
MPVNARAVAVLIVLMLARQGAAASIDAQVRDTSGRPVADAVVYAVPAGAAVEMRGSRTVSIEQLDREFVPYVSVIQAGTQVDFPNRDPIQHHVYSFSPAKNFEFKLYTGKSPGRVVFDKPGVITVGCNIHDWMIAYILVVSTPYFAKVDAAGNAKLRDLRPGTYEVHAWHPLQRGPGAPASLTLDTAASATSAGFNMDVEPRKPRYKPPLDRMRY